MSAAPPCPEEPDESVSGATAKEVTECVGVGLSPRECVKRFHALMRERFVQPGLFTVYLDEDGKVTWRTDGHTSMVVGMCHAFLAHVDEQIRDEARSGN